MKAPTIKTNLLLRWPVLVMRYLLLLLHLIIICLSIATTYLKVLQFINLILLVPRHYKFGVIFEMPKTDYLQSIFLKWDVIFVNTGTNKNTHGSMKEHSEDSTARPQFNIICSSKDLMILLKRTWYGSYCSVHKTGIAESGHLNHVPLNYYTTAKMKQHCH